MNGTMNDPARRANGYAETINKGIAAFHAFSDGFTDGILSRAESIETLKNALAGADAVIIGAGAGLSTAAGLTYSGRRFERYFFDFKAKFGITDMYSGGFFPFPDPETRWTWWARHIYFNRYIASPKPVYEDLLGLIKDKDHFVITTNVDHRFQRAGFDKSRLFYTQGDYGLFQRADGKGGVTYDNEEWVAAAMSAQGFVLDGNGEFTLPDDRESLKMRLPGELIPHTPDGRDVAMNLRADDKFVEDEGWRTASANYAEFLKNHDGARVLFLEIGVGSNTPVIIKLPFWAMTDENKNAFYACLNYSEAYCPKKIESRSVCIDGDVCEILPKLK